MGSRRIPFSIAKYRQLHSERFHQRALYSHAGMRILTVFQFRNEGKFHFEGKASGIAKKSFFYGLE
jgi:hypothetical protein